MYLYEKRELIGDEAAFFKKKPSDKYWTPITKEEYMNRHGSTDSGGTWKMVIGLVGGKVLVGWDALTPGTVIPGIYRKQVTGRTTWSLNNSGGTGDSGWDTEAALWYASRMTLTDSEQKLSVDVQAYCGASTDGQLRVQLRRYNSSSNWDDLMQTGVYEITSRDGGDPDFWSIEIQPTMYGGVVGQNFVLQTQIRETSGSNGVNIPDADYYYSTIGQGGIYKS